jgi:hypothetical protein
MYAGFVKYIFQIWIPNAEFLGRIAYIEQQVRVNSIADSGSKNSATASMTSHAESKLSNDILLGTSTTGEEIMQRLEI